jgi:hypothetical protein
MKRIGEEKKQGDLNIECEIIDRDLSNDYQKHVGNEIKNQIRRKCHRELKNVGN